MEGYLKLWVDIFFGWNSHYLFLSEDILEIFKQKGGERIASLSLKIAIFRSIPEDALRIVINSGTKELQFKASTLAEKQKWLTALENAQRAIEEQANSRLSVKSKTDYRNSVGSVQSKMFLRDSQTIDIDKKLADLRTKQASLDKTANLLEPEMMNNPQLASLVRQLITVGRELGETITECAEDIKQSNKLVPTMINEVQDFKYHNGDTIYTKAQKGHFNSEEAQNYSEGETPYHSFIEEDDEEEHKLQQENNHDGQFNNQGGTKERLNAETRGDQNGFVLHLHPAQGLEKPLHPVIKYLLEKNEAFKGVKLQEEIERSTLPHLVDPNHKMPIDQLIKILKDCVGKDISRFSMPVWVNEPLGMLQHLCQTMEYYQLLIKANQIQDSCLRLAYVCLYAVSSYSTTIGRGKKPFNPLLGETFEYQAPDGSFKFISEQVSHHPPISAAYAEGSAFKVWLDSDSQANFNGNSIEIVPKTHAHVVLNRHSDHIIYRRSLMSVTNIIFGKLYLENHGDMALKNLKTGDKAALHLKKRGWASKGAYEVEGSVSDSNGNIRYKIQGKWDSVITVKDASTGAEVCKWERYPLIPNYDRMHYYTHFVLQLNHITPSMMQKIAPTDTRLRPDQRLLEMGKVEAANKEKNRLEEKQRAVRKLFEKAGREHQPKWFKEILDPETKEKSYEYQGGYWEARQKGEFLDLPDLYSDNTVETQ